MYYDPWFTKILIKKKKKELEDKWVPKASFLFSSSGKVSPTISGWPILLPQPQSASQATVSTESN